MYTTNELILMHRARKGLSQGDAAKRLGMSRATYIESEKGRRSWTLAELEAMAGLFEVPVQTLIGGREATVE